MSSFDFRPQEFRQMASAWGTSASKQSIGAVLILMGIAVWVAQFLTQQPVTAADKLWCGLFYLVGGLLVARGAWMVIASFRADADLKKFDPHAVREFRNLVDWLKSADDNTPNVIRFEFENEAVTYHAAAFFGEHVIHLDKTTPKVQVVEGEHFEIRRDPRSPASSSPRQVVTLKMGFSSHAATMGPRSLANYDSWRATRPAAPPAEEHDDREGYPAAPVGQDADPSSMVLIARSDPGGFFSKKDVVLVDRFIVKSWNAREGKAFQVEIRTSQGRLLTAKCQAASAIGGFISIPAGMMQSLGLRDAELLTVRPVTPAR